MPKPKNNEELQQLLKTLRAEKVASYAADGVSITFDPSAFDVEPAAATPTAEAAPPERDELQTEEEKKAFANTMYRSS